MAPIRPSDLGAGFDLAVAEEEAFRFGQAPPYPAPTAESGGGTPPIRAKLPGQGSPGAGCGQTVPRFFCESEREATVGRHLCERRECPDCAGLCPGGSECPVSLPPHPGGMWAHREALIASERFEDYLEQNQLGRCPIRQVIVSVRKDLYPESGDHDRIVLKVRSHAQALVRRFAWRGRYLGSAIVHLWRNCDGRYDEWGPHAHQLCLGIDVGAWNRYWNEYRRRFHRDPEYVLKQVNSEGGGFAAYRGFSLRRHLVYELGHAAILPRGHALSWFGALKTWRPPPAPISLREPPTCSAGHPMRPWGYPWSAGPISDGAESFTGRCWDSTSHTEVPVEFTIRDPATEGERTDWTPPWGGRPACVYCLSRWKPGAATLRCPHLEG